MSYVIERLDIRADGVTQGLRAPQTLPGEVVTGTVQGNALSEIRIERPSETRVAAPCPHFRSCGGCQLQHAQDEFVANWKWQVVVDALHSAGLETDIRPTLTSPDRSRIRATFAARRTKKGAMAGFFGRRSESIVPVPDCILVLPRLKAALPMSEDLARDGASRKGTLAVSVTDSAAGLDVVVRGGKPLVGPLRIRLAALAEAHGLARLTWEDEVIAMRHPPTQPMGCAQVIPPPGAFLQATAHGRDTLVTAVRDIIGDAGRIVDLFAGCGTFALPLAQGAEVDAYEGDAAMIAALDRGWREAQGLKRVRAAARDLFRRPLMPDELNHDAAVIDPPRAGASAQIAELAQSRIPVIAHVSCNPATFARDAKTLTDAGYRLEFVQPVDQFRWSSHVELVAAFRHPHMAA
ncbi:MAG: class I SAM-dependent RNA methyltransferase [Pseudomonadota bacterium]